MSFLEYVARLFEKVIPLEKRYRQKTVPFVQNCTTLEGYAKLAEYTNEARKAGQSDYLDFAIQRCIAEGILADYDYDTDIRIKKQEAYEKDVSVGITQGISQGIAKQKAEDEKILQQEREFSSQKDAEIAKQAERIRELEAQLANKSLL